MASWGASDADGVGMGGECHDPLTALAPVRRSSNSHRLLWRDFVRKNVPGSPSRNPVPRVHWSQSDARISTGMLTCPECGAQLTTVVCGVGFDGERCDCFAVAVFACASRDGRDAVEATPMASMLDLGLRRETSIVSTLLRAASVPVYEDFE